MNTIRLLFIVILINLTMGIVTLSPSNPSTTTDIINNLQTGSNNAISDSNQFIQMRENGEISNPGTESDGSSLAEALINLPLMLLMFIKLFLSGLVMPLGLLTNSSSTLELVANSVALIAIWGINLTLFMRFLDKWNKRHD